MPSETRCNSKNLSDHYMHKYVTPFIPIARRNLAFGIILFVGMSCSQYRADSIGWVYAGTRDHFEVTKIERLAERMNDAEDDLATARDTLTAIKTEFFEAELEFIENRITLFEERLEVIKRDKEDLQKFRKEELPNLFQKERQELVNIMDSHENFDQKAQQILDRILALITSLKE